MDPISIIFFGLIGMAMFFLARAVMNDYGEEPVNYADTNKDDDFYREETIDEEDDYASHSGSDIYTDPTYCHMPGNIYHSICEDDIDDPDDDLHSSSSITDDDFYTWDDNDFDSAWDDWDDWDNYT